MAWGMSKEKEKIVLTPAKDSLWGQIIQKSIELDNTHGPYHGWHWFFGLYYLYNIRPKIPFLMLELVQEDLPEQHWLKKIHNNELKEDAQEYALKNILADKTLVELFKLIDSLIEKHDITNVIDFSKLTFDDPASFNGFIFPLHVSFEHTHFSCDALFDAAIFCNGCNFTNAKFLSSTAFNNVKFVGLANFEGVRFLNDVTFNKVSFPIIANFQNTKFFKIADFTEAIFSRAASFRCAEFYSLPVFKSTTFKGNTSFMEVLFKKFAPHFYDAEPNADIAWDNNPDLWPQTKKHKNDETDEKHKIRIGTNRSSYENLSYHMKKLDKYHDQHFFFRQEMRCRRKLGGTFNSLIYGLYQGLADYGYGVGRASIAWTLHMCFWAGILFFFVIPDKTPTYERLTCSLLTSASNAHSFLLSRGDHLSNCYSTEKPPLSFDIIWAFGTIFGAMFLFLLLTTLRIRFRLK